MCTKSRLMTGTGTCIQLTEMYMYLTMALLKPLNIGRSYLSKTAISLCF